MPAARPHGEGLIIRRVQVDAQQVAWLRYVLEGHDGLALMHSAGSGEVSLLAPWSQSAALDELIADLLREGCVRALVREPDP